MFLARPASTGAGRALAVKDLFDTEGLATTYGSAIFRDHVPERSARAVVRLEAAGWANAGKTNLHEFAFGITSQNPHYGTVPNPARPGRVAGGSSGGSAAALAAGLCEGALGTDTGGSIRIPAACCEVVGFKPSYGLVPMHGCFPLAPSFDHAGPMARSVGGCVEMIEVLAPGFERSGLRSLDDAVVGVVWLEHADPEVRGAVEVAASCFPRRRAIELPLAGPLAPAFLREVAQTHERLFAEHRDLYGANVAGKIERCLAVTDAAYGRAEAERDLYRERVAEVFDQVDLLLTPTLACAPHPDTVDELEIRELYTRLTFPFNAAGAPALALPCGGASVQLAGPPAADAPVLAAGELLERQLGRVDSGVYRR